MRLALLTLAITLLATILAPHIAPFDPMRTTAGTAMQAPSTTHLLGTDLLGRDVFSRVLYGGRRTLSVAAAATVIAVLPGLVVGSIAGASRKSIDQVIMVITNSLLAIPPLVIALVILTIAGQGAGQLAVATGLAQIAMFAQVTRAATNNIQHEGYIEAARAIGGGWLHIMRHHTLPNICPTLHSYAGVVFAYSIINSAALSFLGLGGDPGIPDWGTIMADGRMAFQMTPWVAIVPGLLIMSIVMAINTLVDTTIMCSPIGQMPPRKKNLQRLIQGIRYGKNTRT